MSLGMVFPIAIVLGYFLGRWIGGLMGHPKLGQYLGLALGIATGFWELYKVTLRLDRMDPPPPPTHGPQEGDDRDPEA
ncbi:MAG: AtpZ/AtpI family protein [Holophaga sp.]|nr:AtpZ/AtpI family protein [Holophaga sp.]